MSSRPASEANDDVVIERVRYQPRTEQNTGVRRFSTTQVIVGAFAVLAIGFLTFLFAARSVQFVFTPPVDEIRLSGGPSMEVGGTHLMMEAGYRLSANSQGYYPIDTEVTITGERNQRFEFSFVPLPGKVTFDTVPDGVVIAVDRRPLGETPLTDVDVDAGTRSVTFAHSRYQDAGIEVDVVGRQQPQIVRHELVPNWADVTISSVPDGARILVDEIDTGQVTPAVVEILAGEHDIRLRLDGHKSHLQRVLVGPLEERALDAPTLSKADGVLDITSNPPGAGVTLDGKYVGATPLKLELPSGRRFRLQAYKAGFAPANRTLRLTRRETRKLDLTLTQLTGLLQVVSQPSGGTLYVDGDEHGGANQTLELPTRPHDIEIRLPGYAGYRATVTPRNGLTQEVKVRLLTLAEARLAALKPLVKTVQGQAMVLLEGSTIRLGASRREPGRRANEILRDASFTRLFYLATSEVTNAQFRAFADGHDSGSYEDQNLNKDDQPAVNLSWHDAARYCNWLSAQEGRDPFYTEEFSKVRGFNPGSNGYRLPSEVEWAWSARHDSSAGEPLRFPWGKALPPPDRHGNYADRSAAHLVGRIIFGYNDNYSVSAPVETFAANAHGLHDLGGNAAEWVHDFYEIPSANAVKDHLGPAEGEYHVIKGSSWMHGTATDLRLSFRDYGIDARRDVGFRIARYAE